VYSPIAARARADRHYDRVDPEQVWVIASKDVPAMVESISRLSGEQGTWPSSSTTGP